MATNDVSPEARFICGHGPRRCCFDACRAPKSSGAVGVPGRAAALAEGVPLEVDSVLGSRPAWRCTLDGGEERFFNGWVTAASSRGGAVGRFDVYRVEMRPWLWYLTLDPGLPHLPEQDRSGDHQAVFDEYNATAGVTKLKGRRAPVRTACSIGRPTSSSSAG
jgi:uncharacterized protein involved in type VI secretion and phage assembly